jgi:hypothetical protein
MKNYVISARIEIDIDCVNTPLQRDEELFLEQEFTKMIEDRGMKIKNMEIIC